MNQRIGCGLVHQMMCIYDQHNLQVDFVFHQEYEILEIEHENEYHGMDGEMRHIEIIIDGILLVYLILVIQI